MYKKLIILLVCLSCPLSSKAQAGSVSQSQISSFTTNFSNADWHVRMDAFYGLLGLAPNVPIGSYVIQNEIVNLLSAASDPDPINIALINLLVEENSYVLASNQSFTGNTLLPEQYTDYYADLIVAVVTLKDNRSISALVGAITTGGTVVGALASFGNSSINLVLPHLSDSDAGVRGSATLVLLQMLNPINFSTLSLQTILGAQTGLVKASSFSESYIGSAAANGLAQLDSKRVAVEIDIKPGSTPSPINAGAKGDIPVAILSTSTFNALSINTSTLTFGHTGYEASLDFCNKGGEDINGDGLLDLVCHFSTTLTGFQVGDTTAVLRGIATGPTPFIGKNSVHVIK